MFFIGGGTLLHHAVHYSRSIGLAVRGVCCPSGATARQAFRKSGITVIESDDPNADLPRLAASLRGATVFSINNKYLLDDVLLSSGASFFNIHNGLAQKYRGLSEVCIFAALCKNEEEYGVTLHRILPGQRVDSGPVVDQMVFDVMGNDCFSDVMDESLRLCRRIFERNVRRVAQGSFGATEIQSAPRSFNYGHLPDLYANADPDAKRRAAALGAYRAYFPRLHMLVASTAESRGNRIPRRAAATGKARRTS